MHFGSWAGALSGGGYNTQVGWRTLRGCTIGALSVRLFTVVAFRLHLSFPTASFCCLLLLVSLSLSGNFVSSAVASLLAVGCLDYFFLEPIFSFQLDSSLDTLGLASFLITSLVITKLVTKLRDQTELSQLHQKRMQRLYQLAQQLLALEPDPKNGTLFLAPFCGVFGIRAICLFDASGAEVFMAGNAGDDLEKRTGEAFIHRQDCENHELGISIRCIHVGGRTIGAIGFEGLEDPALTAGPLTALAAAHVERTHSLAHASRAAATIQTESYRSAILDALAPEFKTPLSTILTAAGALVRSGGYGAPVCKAFRRPAHCRNQGLRIERGDGGS